MRPAGQAQVDAAQADGRWAAAYAGQKGATVPDDLAAALAADPQAKAFFESLPVDFRTLELVTAPS